MDTARPRRYVSRSSTRLDRLAPASPGEHARPVAGAAAGPVEAAAPSIDVLADVVLHPSFPQTFEAGAASPAGADRQEKATPTTAVVRLVPPILYGSAHPTGAADRVGVRGHRLEADSRDLVSWHRDWFQPSRTTIIVTGDTTWPPVKPELDRVQRLRPVRTYQRVTAGAGHRRQRVTCGPAGISAVVIVAAHVSETCVQPRIWRSTR